MKSLDSGKHAPERSGARRGNVLVTVALLLPVFLAIAALVLDGSALISRHRRLQHSADAVALAAATAMLQEKNPEAAVSRGRQFAERQLDIRARDVEIASPPSRGSYAGHNDCVSVTLSHTADSLLSHLVDNVGKRDVQARATACVTESPAQAALVCLDRSPELCSFTGLPTGVGSSLSLAGLELEGVGLFKVAGAIHVNSLNGMYDQHGNRVGEGAGPPYGVACLPGFGMTSIEADEIRVAGGVANPANYGSALKANRLPVPDPHDDLPVPDPGIHSDAREDEYGGVTVAEEPLRTSPVVLEPGIYDWIQVLSGEVVFRPGVYIVTGRHPVTQRSLALVGGKVRAEGVMFYVGQNWKAGQPPHDEGEPPYTADTLAASVVIAETLGPSSISGLNSPASPFDGFLLYQERHDRRPIAVVAQQLLRGHTLSGHVYSKWGHLVLGGQGTFGLTLVAGTIRVVVAGELCLAPEKPLPAARDVFLVD